mgnify:CR=1 FL=1
MELLLILYGLFIIPILIVLVIGLFMLWKKPEIGKKMLIIVGIYFLIGLGICSMWEPRY